MKIAILADAHGNQFGFSAALKDAKRQQVDLIVSAGDMLASFPGGPEILSILLSEGIPTVLGNADELLLKWWHACSTNHFRASPQFRPLQSAATLYRDDAFRAIAQWPRTHLITHAGRRVLICHGTPDNNRQSIEDLDWSPTSSIVDAEKPDIVIAGHRHHQWSEVRNGTILVLAGSCGMPTGGEVNAQYTILDAAAEVIRVYPQTVNYDRQQFLTDLKAHEYAREASPVGWLELAQILTARPLMKYYFQDHFDATQGPDVEHLSQSIREYLQSQGVLDKLEAEFGLLTI